MRTRLALATCLALGALGACSKRAPDGDEPPAAAADLRAPDPPITAVDLHPPEPPAASPIALALPGREHGRWRVSAVDPRGNIYLTGLFLEDQDFGGGPLKNHGGDDAFLVKLGPDGRHLWSRALGGRGHDLGLAVSATDDGVALVGSFEGEADLGGGTLTSRTRYACFLARFGPDGTHRFSRSIDIPEPNTCYDVSLDGGGDAWLIGAFSGAIDVGGTSLQSAGASDGFHARFAADGRLVAARRFGGSGGDAGWQIAAGPGGALAIAGLFTGTLDLGAGPLTSDGENNSFFALLDGDGKALWSRRLGPVADWVFSLALSADALYVGGEVQGEVDFGGGKTQPVGTRDAYAARYDRAGRLAWARRFGAVAGEDRAVIGWSVGLLAGEDAVLAGEFAGTLQAGDTRHESRGGVDGFAIRLSPAGGVLGSWHFGAAGSSVFETTAPARGADAVVLSGALFGTVDFAGTSLTSTDRRQIFLVQLPGAPVVN